jgi:bacterioferritin (cytochrome b1)
MQQDEKNLNSDNENFEEIYKNVYEFYCEDPIAAKVMKQVSDRSSEGMKAYGHEIIPTSKTVKEWLEEALEEAIDQAVYLRAAITLLEEQKDDIY